MGRLVTALPPLPGSPVVVDLLHEVGVGRFVTALPSSGSPVEVDFLHEVGVGRFVTALPSSGSPVVVDLLHEVGVGRFVNSLRFNRYAEPLPPLSWRGIPEE